MPTASPGPAAARRRASRLVGEVSLQPAPASPGPQLRPRAPRRQVSWVWLRLGRSGQHQLMSNAPEGRGRSRRRPTPTSGPEALHAL